MLSKNNYNLDPSSVGLFSASFIIALVLWLNPSLLLYKELSINLAKILLIFSIMGSGLISNNEDKKETFSDLSVGLGLVAIFIAWINSTDNINIPFILLFVRFIFLIILMIGVFGTASGISRQINIIYSDRKLMLQKEIYEIERQKITKKEIIEFIFQLIGAAASIATIYQIVETS